jgi:hypothetical protein
MFLFLATLRNAHHQAHFSSKKRQDMNENEVAELGRLLCEEVALQSSAVDQDFSELASGVPLLYAMQQTGPNGESMTKTFCSKLKMETIKRGHGHEVFHEGEQGDRLYFVRAGVLGVYIHDGATRVAELTKGSYFGESAILNTSSGSFKRSATVKVENSTGGVELLSISRAQVVMLQKLYPGNGGNTSLQEFISEHFDQLATGYRT